MFQTSNAASIIIFVLKKPEICVTVLMHMLKCREWCCHVLMIWYYSLEWMKFDCELQYAYPKIMCFAWRNKCFSKWEGLEICSKMRWWSSLRTRPSGPTAATDVQSRQASRNTSFSTCRSFSWRQCNLSSLRETVFISLQDMKDLEVRYKKVKILFPLLCMSSCLLTTSVKACFFIFSSNE